MQGAYGGGCCTGGAACATCASPHLRRVAGSGLPGMLLLPALPVLPMLPAEPCLQPLLRWLAPFACSYLQTCACLLALLWPAALDRAAGPPLLRGRHKRSSDGAGGEEAPQSCSLLCVEGKGLAVCRACNQPFRWLAPGITCLPLHSLTTCCRRMPTGGARGSRHWPSASRRLTSMLRVGGMGGSGVVRAM